MGKWIALFVLIISSSILGYLYFELENVASDTPPIIPEVSSRTQRVFHSFDSGEHRYMGEIKLPHSCYELKVHDITTDPRDSTKHAIILTSIDRMLDVRLCVQFPTRYPFDVIITGPEKISTTLVVDGTEVPMRIVETAWQSAEGSTVITPDRSKI